MTWPPTLHIWLPNWRSLCDRRPHLRFPTTLRSLSESAFSAELDQQTSAPACGACILVSCYIRELGAVLVAAADYNGLGIHPPTPAGAYLGLSETLWFNDLDIDGEPPAGLDDAGYYRQKITSPIDDTWLRAAAQAAAAESIRWREEMHQWRERSR